MIRSPAVPLPTLLSVCAPHKALLLDCTGTAVARTRVCAQPTSPQAPTAKPCYHSRHSLSNASPKALHPAGQHTALYRRRSCKKTSVSAPAFDPIQRTSCAYEAPELLQESPSQPSVLGRATGSGAPIQG